MKKLFLLSAIALGLTFTSCNKDDDGGNNSAPLEGKWYYSEEGIGANGQVVLQDYDDHEVGCEKDYIEFLEGGVFKDVDYYNTDCESYTDTTVWERSENTVTVGTGEFSQTAKITLLNSNVLKLTVTENMGGQSASYITVYTRN